MKPIFKVLIDRYGAQAAAKRFLGVDLRRRKRNGRRSVKLIFMVMPTWNNARMCAEAIRTLFDYTEFEKYGKLLVVDNSPELNPELFRVCENYRTVYYRHQKENLGWMKSVNGGFRFLHNVGFPFFTMVNDDIIFPHDKQFWPRTIALFEKDPQVAGVGPISNYVMGPQFQGVQVPGQVGEVSYLIGFCATYRTSVLESVGLLDEALPGGDDLDLSIRVRQTGGKLLCDRRSFVFHFGSVTGNRVHSDWDTHESQLRTANALIAKHGFKAWYRGISPMWEVYTPAEPSSISDSQLKEVLGEIDKLAVFIGSVGAAVVEGSCTPNMRDAKSKGRIPRGSTVGTSRLIESQVTKIRRLLASKKMTQWAIARKFGVSQSTISFIKRRIRWNHVEAQ